MYKNVFARLKSLFTGIDWKLFLFLILFLNVKLPVKVAAIILLYIAQPNFKFGFNARFSRLPLFYAGMIVIAVVNWFLNGNYTYLNLNISFVLGILFWVLCILVIHQLKLFTEKNDPAVIHNTIRLFFILNALVSFLNYFIIVLKTGAINPYQFQGNFQKYFLSTGDMIRGLTFDVSTTNALLNAYGVIYFLRKRNMVMTIVCMAILLMTGSNFTNLLIVVVLLFMFAFQSDRLQKSLVMIGLFLMVLFMAKVSPQNNEYAIVSLNQLLGKNPPVASKQPIKEKSLRDSPDSLLSKEERKQKTALLYLDSLGKEIQRRKLLANKKLNKLKPPNMTVLRLDINSGFYQRKLDTTASERELLKLAQDPINLPFNILYDSTYKKGLPGKLVAFKQTALFLKDNPARIATGVGTGNFSSKLAYRTTALGISGSYPKKLAYLNLYFRINHFALFMLYFSKDESLHSVMNTSNCVYDQLAGEYGIAGILLFLFFYLGYFTRRAKKIAYSLPLILVTLGAFVMDYWYEQLSIVIIFELLLLLDIKETSYPEKEKQ